jgi:hypothetical protein
VGASDWHYTVAYQPDVKAALQQLRRDVYDRGEYYREPADNDLAMTEDEFRARLDPRGENDGLNDAIVEDWLERKNLPMPSDPDTLLAAQPHSGTHSIIDIAKWRVRPSPIRHRVRADRRRVARSLRHHRATFEPGTGVDQVRLEHARQMGRHVCDQLSQWRA